VIVIYSLNNFVFDVLPRSLLLLITGNDQFTVKVQYLYNIYKINVIIIFSMYGNINVFEDYFY